MDKLLKRLLLVIIVIISNFSFAKEERFKTMSSNFDKRFVVHSTKSIRSNIILDRQSNLLWQDQQTVIDRLFYVDTAKKYCSNLDLGSLDCNPPKN